MYLGRPLCAVRGPDRDDAGAKLDTDSDIMLRTEAALAEADGEGGFAAARVADADELGDVVPGRGRGHWRWGFEAWEAKLQEESV